MTFQTILPIRPMQFGTENTDGVSKVNSNAQMPFAQVLQDAVNQLQQTQETSAADSYNLATGNTDDLSKIMINASKETAAVQFTTELCTRVVNAYKEMMQMQI